MQLITIMAGAAGEDIYFGELAPGVEGGLDRASKLARSMVVSYGMSDAFGPVSIGEKAGEVFLGRDIQNLGHISPVQLELIDNEVRQLVMDAIEVAKRVVRANTESMDEVVDTLLQHETLSGVALQALLSSVIPYEGDLTLLRR